MAPNTPPPAGNGTNGHSPNAASAPQGDWTALFHAVSQDARRPRLQSLKPREGDDPSVLVVPDGYQLKAIKALLDEYRTRPQLRAGTTELRDLASFIAWTNRHRDDDSMIYADDSGSAPLLTAVIDHDQAGGDAPDSKARFGRHRGIYRFPLSREWLEWFGAHRKPLTTTAFAEFLERRIGDVAPPPYSVDEITGKPVLATADPEIRKLAETLGKKFASTADLAKLMQGIELNSEAKATSKINRDTGESHIEYIEQNGQGTDRVKPPNAFLIAVPVVDNGPAFLIAVHLRYRAAGGTITWFVELHQPERVMEQVFSHAIDQVEDEIDLDLVRGIAPTAR
mgnify:CR=1 FL=1